jgi:hypothetical protein
MNDQPFYGGRTSFSSPRSARRAASTDPDVKRIVDRLLAANAVRPENARALQQLSAAEQAALDRLKETGLVQSVGRDLYWIHPMAWDERLDDLLRRQAKIVVVVAIIALLTLWLRYWR